MFAYCLMCPSSLVDGYKNEERLYNQPFRNI